MKLLDIINPTDYAEMAQNQMEDSRLPVWALNLEAGNTQIVISEPKENVFAGLNRGTGTSIRINATDGTMVDLTLAANALGAGTDETNVFRMMGPETITGATNGFLNITPDMGGIARRFAWGFGKKDSLNDARMAGFTVGGFELMSMGGNTQNVNGYYSMPFSMGNVAVGNGGNMLCITANAGTGTCTADVVNDNYDSDNDASTWFYTDLPDNFESAIAGVAGALGRSVEHMSELQ